MGQYLKPKHPSKQVLLAKTKLCLICDNKHTYHFMSKRVRMTSAILFQGEKNSNTIFISEIHS